MATATKAQMGENRGSWLERFFSLSERGTNVRTELLAGMTTFVTMAYIIFVNPDILASTGMDKGALFVATILAAAASTLVMGLFANMPFALAPGMGLNAFFAFYLVGELGVPWQTALGAVLLSGVMAVVVTLTGLRQMMITAIPPSLKHAVSAGIGFFIMMVGFKNAGIVVASEATIAALGNLASPEVVLAIIGLVITAALVTRKVTGAILIGIVVTTLLGIPLGVTEVPSAIFSLPPSVAPTFLQLDFKGVFTAAMFPVVFSMFFADLFDTIGTFVGVADKSGLMDEEGNLPGGGRPLFADSLGTIIGALFGTSNTTTYVESAAGVAVGGRTGLTAVTTAGLFILALFASPVALAIPGAATAPALIIVGIMMASSLLEIDLSDFGTAFPAILTALMMPLTFSISTGLALGFTAYVVTNLLIGRAKETHWMMYVLGAFFIYYFIAV